MSIYIHLFYQKKIKKQAMEALQKLPITNVCGGIRTTGAFPHPVLAGRHHKPLGHANMG